MGKALRRTSAVAATLAAAVAFAGSAVAAGSPSGSYQDNSDSIQSQWSIDNNLDNLFRVAGPDRISTSIKLMESTSKWAFCGMTDEQLGKDTLKIQKRERNCDTVIVASADNYPDALAAAPLADVYNAPVLLTHEQSIDSRVLAAISAHGFKNAIIVGGTGIFPAGAMQQLEAVTAPKHVQQVGGINRYQTAVKIAQRVGWKVANKTNGVTPWTVNVYLASGVDFPDALAAGAAAADNDGVVLLTAKGGLEQFTQDFLDGQAGWNSFGGKAVFNKREIHVVGGPAKAAVDNSTIEDVNPANVTVGKDRYDTAAQLAGKFHHDIHMVAVASGEGFADGVAAGAFVANHDGALLLTRNNFLSPQTKTFLEGVADTTVPVVVVGGNGAVSPKVSQQIADELYTW